MNDVLTFFNNNKDAIASIGVLSTAFIGLITLFISKRNNKMIRTNININNKIERLNRIQSLISEYVGQAKINLICDFTTESTRDEQNLMRISTEIKLNLLNDSQSEEIIELLDDINSTYDDAVQLCCLGDELKKECKGKDEVLRIIKNPLSINLMVRFANYKGINVKNKEYYYSKFDELYGLLKSKGYSNKDFFDYLYERPSELLTKNNYLINNLVYISSRYIDTNRKLLICEIEGNYIKKIFLKIFREH